MVEMKKENGIWYIWRNDEWHVSEWQEEYMGDKYMRILYNPQGFSMETMISEDLIYIQGVGGDGNGYSVDEIIVVNKHKMDEDLFNRNIRPFIIAKNGKITYA